MVNNYTQRYSKVYYQLKWQQTVHIVRHASIQVLLIYLIYTVRFDGGSVNGSKRARRGEKLFVLHILRRSNILFLCIYTVWTEFGWFVDYLFGFLFIRDLYIFYKDK